MKGLSVKFAGLVLITILLGACGMDADEQVPEAWKHLVKTEGQAYPVPESWLSTPEGRIAHNLKLPDSVPKPVPFDFEKARGAWYWPTSRKDVKKTYFEHLCKAEAGEWVFKKVENVEGLYFARPRGNMEITDDFLLDPYELEAPALERHFQVMGDSADSRGGQYVSPPFRNYQFVEEPQRDVKWQKDIHESYIRLFGYTSAVIHNPKFGKIPGATPYLEVREKTPMQVVGIPEPSAKYAYTWRGITRPHDRELRIAGVELIAYERSSGAIIALRRTFALSGDSTSYPGKVGWMTAPTCNHGEELRLEALALTEFAKRVIPAYQQSQRNKGVGVI